MSGRTNATGSKTRQGGRVAVLIAVAIVLLWPLKALTQDGTPEPPPVETAVDTVAVEEPPTESVASDTPTPTPAPAEEQPLAPTDLAADAPSPEQATTDPPSTPEATTAATTEEAIVPPGPVAFASPVADEGASAVSAAFGPAAATTSLSHAAAQVAQPGTVAAYPHTVGNLAPVADAKFISATSTAGWPVVVLAGDGATPLPDGDGDGVPETEAIPAGQAVEIVVQVTVPADRPAGEVGVVVVTAGSVQAQDPGEAVSVQDVVTVDAVVTLAVDTEVVDFGRVAADGRLDGAAPGVTSEADAGGAYYVASEAVAVTVTSNAAWTGTCLATEDDGTDPASWIAGGRLEWRLAGTTTWAPFTTTGAACFPAQPAGTSVFVFDVRLRLERTDGARTFRATVTFAATT